MSWATVAPVIAFLTLPISGHAQAPNGASGGFSLSFSGYGRSLAGIRGTGYDVPGGERVSGFLGGVGRLKWRARWDDRVMLDVHNRVQVHASSGSGGLGGTVAGFGVSSTPERSVDLESVWIDREDLRFWHDIDRLALTVYTSAADITIGRQAITWGISLLFSVSDLWTQFSPFELDTEEKPGVDALRVLSYPTPGLEVDMILADLGSANGVSAGVRATWSLTSADVHMSVGRFWNEAIALGGVALLFDTWKLRGEGVAPLDLDEDRWMDPRVTVGIDRLGSRLTLSAEYHFNGLGADEPAGYLAELQSQRFIRGESYFLARHYVGGAATWTVDDQERIRIGGTALVNLSDSSGAFLPSLTWDLGQSLSISLGGLLAVGDGPSFVGPLSELRSEYGTYGSVGHAQISTYF